MAAGRADHRRRPLVAAPAALVVVVARRLAGPAAARRRAHGGALARRSGSRWIALALAVRGAEPRVGRPRPPERPLPRVRSTRSCSCSSGWVAAAVDVARHLPSRSPRADRRGPLVGAGARGRARGGLVASNVAHLAAARRPRRRLPGGRGRRARGSRRRSPATGPTALDQPARTSSRPTPYAFPLVRDGRRGSSDRRATTTWLGESAVVVAVRGRLRGVDLRRAVRDVIGAPAVVLPRIARSRRVRPLRLDAVDRFEARTGPLDLDLPLTTRRAAPKMRTPARETGVRCPRDPDVEGDRVVPWECSSSARARARSSGTTGRPVAIVETPVGRPRLRRRRRRVARTPSPVGRM